VSSRPQCSGHLAFFTWDLYDQVWWYDKAMHVFTTFAFTLPLPLLLYDRILKGLDKHRFLLFLTVTALGIALGTIWEIAEWGMGQIWGDPSLSEPRLDVITDLIVDAVGASLAALASLKILQQRLSRRSGEAATERQEKNSVRENALTQR